MNKITVGTVNQAFSMINAAIKSLNGSFEMEINLNDGVKRNATDVMQEFNELLPKCCKAHFAGCVDGVLKFIIEVNIPIIKKS